MAEETHLQRILQDYANGESLRFEIADNIVAEFRPFLKKGHDGPNYDGPLFARLMEALTAAENHGRGSQEQLRQIEDEPKKESA